MAGKSGCRPLIMRARLFAPPARNRQRSALPFEPRKGAHFLGGQLVLRFLVERARFVRMPHLALPVGQPRQVVPRAILPNQLLETGAGLFVVAFLKSNLGQNRASGKAL